METIGGVLAVSTNRQMPSVAAPWCPGRQEVGAATHDRQPAALSAGGAASRSDDAFACAFLACVASSSSSAF
jgi:hypothetical protein